MNDRDKWNDIILDWERSGMHQKEFCKSNGLDFKQFKYWRGQGLSSGEFSRMNRHQISDKNHAPINEEVSKTFTPIELTAQPHPPSSVSIMLELHLPRGVILKLPI